MANNNEAVLFRNWTDFDFTWKWDGVEYTFRAGQAIFLEKFKADHFAKHLTDEVLNRKKLATNDHTRGTYLAKCFEGASIFAENGSQLETKLLNENMPETLQDEQDEVNAVAKDEIKCKECGSKGYRHKKGCPKLKGEE